jgi:thiamine biosynthesis lipoprotein
VRAPSAAPARAELPAFGGAAVVLTADPGALDEALAVVRRHIEAMDLACSRFRPDSELSRVNAAAGQPVAVGDLFATALETALRAAELTAGDVDPTCGAALVAAGYDRDFAQLRGAGVALTVTGPRPSPGWRTVRWDAANRRVTVPRGALLDFGATAKALAADLAAREAHDRTGGGVLVSFSGDISAFGVPPEGGWRVRVTDDHRAGDDSPGQTVTLADGGLATSSTVVRRWSAGSAQFHHIIDPRSGRPASSCWRTVSVAAADCVAANTAATAAIVRGEAAPGWLAALNMPARFVRPDGSVVTVAAWPADHESGGAS